MHITCVILFVYNNKKWKLIKLYPIWWWPQEHWPKHVIDKLYTPDNIVVLWLLYPYRIITLDNTMTCVIIRTWPLGSFHRIDYLKGWKVLYSIRQKYPTIWQHSCEWNRWCGEFVLECPSSETQNISVAMERCSVQHRTFAVETYF